MFSDRGKMQPITSDVSDPKFEIGDKVRDTISGKVAKVESWRYCYCRIYYDVYAEGWKKARCRIETDLRPLVSKAKAF